MSNDPFSNPASAGKFDAAAWHGSLLLIEVHGVETGIPTVHGPTDAIRADVAVLDGSSAGATSSDVLIFPKVLQSQLRSRIGGKVLGRLAQGQANVGQSPPWVLSDATDADRQLGLQWLNRLASPAPAQTTQQVPQQAAPQPAAQPAASAAPPWAQQTA